MNLGQIKTAGPSIIRGKGRMGRTVVAVATQGFPEQIETLLRASEPKGDHAGLAARAWVGELRVDQSDQFRQSAQVQLQRFESLRELPGSVVLPLRAETLDEQVE